MGIQGLLPLLKDIQRKTSVSIFHGNAVGIDAYCWLHKGVYGCAKDVVEGRKTNVYINYILRRVNMLMCYNITPILVFDGGYLPAKASKEKERRQTREENLKKGKAFLRAGNTAQAIECFQRCAEITPAMASEVIQACREKNVMCIVAPYEADAQLAYLEMQGITQFTITEDSDLLIYGCKKVLFKMNSDGDGVLIDLNELNKVKTVALESFTMEKFRHMCILSGCDYLQSIKGLGLYKAHKFLKKSTNVYKAIQLIKQEKKLTVPTEYAESFRKTDAVFKYQLVFDPRTKQVVRLNDILEADHVTDDELRFAGPLLDKEKAIRIALGNIDPITGKLLADFNDFVHPTTSKKQDIVSESTFMNTEAKIRNPKVNYSLGEETNDTNEVIDVVEEQYLKAKNDESELPRIEPIRHSTRDSDEEDQTPRESLKNIHLYEEQNPPIAASIGVLYGENKMKDSSSITLGHHSVFVKRARHKFKNPFRCDHEMNNSPVATKSRYFDSTKDEKENSDVASSQALPRYPEPLIENETFSTVENKGDMAEDYIMSPPPSKRSKFSFIEYLDSHSKNSLKRAATTVLFNHSSQSSPESDQSLHNIERKCSPLEVKRINVERQPLLPISPEFIESNKKESEMLTLSRFMISKRPNIVKNDQATVLSNRVSLFKDSFDAKTKSCASDEVLEINSQSDIDSRISLNQLMPSDNETTSQLSQGIHSQNDHYNAPLLHLKSRSQSDSSLLRRPIIGKCKKIGLSKKSRSSLDRVRENQSKLTQTKLGFEKFAFSKKKIDWNEKSKEDVTCNS